MTTIRTRLLATSMITGLAFIAAPAGAAFAADATADASPMATMDANGPAPAAAPVQQLRATAEATAAAATTGEIVVTGSRIPQPNLTSSSPILAVGHQEFQLQGKTDAIDILNNLPQNFQNNVADLSNTSNPLNGPGGVATADLRGLGPQRTLVLVNGRRLGIGDANTGNNNPAPDLDQIPVVMIDHVEVVTGGASATYGSDAVAGVVNFILKQNFEGVQVDATFGADQHSQNNGAADGAIRNGISGGLLGPLKLPGDAFDGQNEDASIMFGVNAPDGKGNITAYFEYRHQSPVLYKNRDFAACQIVVAGGRPVCTGSANSNLFEPLNPAASVPTGTVVGNQLLPFPQTGTSPPAYFNSNNYEYLSRGDTRYLAGFQAHYDFSEHATIYSEFSFMSDNTITQIAPSGSFAGGNPFDPTGSGGFLINCNNPLMSAQQAGAIGCSAADIAAGNSQDVFIGRRNIEGGPRISTYDHLNFRGVLGIRGDISDAWHYDVYGSYYNTFLNQGNLNYLSYSRMGKALQVVNVGGTPTCLSVINGSDSACVPWNIFQTGGVTSAALNYLDTLGFESGTVTQEVIEGDLNGDLGKYGIKSPWAEDGIAVAFGFDWRRDQLDFQPDQVVGSGDLGGGSGVGAAIHKGIDVWEGYGETRIPIVQNMEWAHLLQIEGGIRYSGYSTGPSPVTFKAGLEWEPVEDFRFRASFQRAIRAPNVIELFNPITITQSNSFGANGDPCSGASPVFTLAQCERTGLTAAQYGHITQCFAGQCDTSAGGNPNLTPEQADTYSVGATFQPRWVRGLTASIDWWDIKETNFVGTIPPNIIVTQCATTGQLCNLIHRSPSTGFLFGPSDINSGGYVVGNGQNIAGGEAEGIDFQGNYRLALEDVGAHGYGSVDFAFNGTYQLAGSTVLPGIVPYDCTGLYGSKCQTVNPVWRHTLRLTWDTPWNVLASLQWRYLGGVGLDTNTSNPTLTNGKHDAFDANIPAINYLDLSAAWRVNTVFTVRAGINNILDQDPPLVNNKITGTGTPNTYPTYDLLGRQMFVSATAKF